MDPQKPSIEPIALTVLVSDRLYKHIGRDGTHSSIRTSHVLPPRLLGVFAHRMAGDLLSSGARPLWRLRVEV